jgi:hypothetical protein
MTKRIVFLDNVTFQQQERSTQMARLQRRRERQVTAFPDDAKRGARHRTPSLRS